MASEATKDPKRKRTENQLPLGVHPLTTLKSKKIDAEENVMWSVKASGKADHCTFLIPFDCFSSFLPPLGVFIDEVTAPDSDIQVRYWYTKLHRAIDDGDDEDIKSFQDEKLPYVYFVNVGCYIESFLYVA